MNFSHLNMPDPASLTVRPAKDSDLSQIVNLDRLAFAPLQSNEAIQQQWYSNTVNLPGRKLFLAVEDETAQGIGVYTQLDFTAFFEGQEVPIMGIGGVAVAPHRRGQRVARLMLEHALKAAREQQIPLMALYPFQHGFYRRLGWAWVEPVHQYRVSTQQLPLYQERSRIFPSNLDQQTPALKEIYSQAASQHNGWLKRQDWQWQSWLKPVAGREIYTYQESGQLLGYVVLQFAVLDPPKNVQAVIIREWVALTPSAYRGILGFLASLRDQISTIVWTTFPADPFPHLLTEQRRDPTLSHSPFEFGLVRRFGETGGGLMWRLADVTTALQRRPIGFHPAFAITFQIRDPIFGQQILGFEFRDGQIHLVEDHPYPILKLSIEHLTQLFCGVRRSRDLLWTGELEVEGNDSLLAQLDYAWQAEPPFCWDFF
ncbi:MAG: GNAT family N-acetyltransferase [Leptodesmis sp.]|uniref:GNAT family N-acetyltransferase n=1 Tax=Leptodesmis sp. TaxID=3100501 RepID=UPI003D116D2F